MTDQTSLEDFHARDSTETETEAEEITETASESATGPSEDTVDEEVLERLGKIDRKVGVLFDLYGDLHSDLDEARERGEFEHSTESGPETSSMFY